MPRQASTKTYSYASAFYARCLQEATDTVIEGDRVKLWKGFIGQTARELDIPRGMEQKIIKPLTEMGCLEVLTRGVGPHPSILVLRHAPTEDLWVGEDRAPVGLTRRATFATMVADVENIKRSLGGVNLAEALIALDQRLEQLERKVKQLQRSK